MNQSKRNQVETFNNLKVSVCVDIIMFEWPWKYRKGPDLQNG